MIKTLLFSATCTCCGQSLKAGTDANVSSGNRAKHLGSCPTKSQAAARDFSDRPYYGPAKLDSYEQECEDEDPTCNMRSSY